MRLSRLPLRLRLVAGFAGAMLVVLVAAGAFVFWRVQFALDARLDQDLRSQTDDLRQAAARLTPAAALASLRDQAREGQVLTPDGRVLASGSGIADRRALLSPAQARRANERDLQTERGYLFSHRGRHLRILAAPVRGPGPGAVAVTAVRLDQRDEALRELLAQLAIANLLALALASLVGYRLTRAALDPVERYRAQAEQIADGATGVRLDIPAGPPDEISRLGLTLNTMLDAQDRAVQRQQQFIDDASHELRTPLSTIAAEIDLALRKARTADQHEQTLRRLATASSQLIDLAETLLTLGALGSNTPQAADRSARDILHAAARRADSQLAAGHPGSVHVRCPPDVVLHADSRLLALALGNLVDNAVRHGGHTITLAAASMTMPAGAILSVHDDGPGISTDFLGHAAERFRRHESSRAGAGAGLGLSLVDAIATAHGGQLRICSAGRHHHQPTAHLELEQIACTHPEAGTTVSVVLPAAATPLNTSPRTEN